MTAPTRSAYICRRRALNAHETTLKMPKLIRLKYGKPGVTKFCRRDHRTKISSVNLKKQVAQFTTDAELELEADQDLFAEISTLLDDEGSAEDVICLPRRICNSDTMRSVLTGSAMRVWNGNAELPQDLIDFVYGLVPREDVEVAEEILQVKESKLPDLKRRNAQAEIASGEHVGDEFHFRIRIPVPKGREIPNAANQKRKNRNSNLTNFSTSKKVLK